MQRSGRGHHHNISKHHTPVPDKQTGWRWQNESQAGLVKPGAETVLPMLCSSIWRVSRQRDTPYWTLSRETYQASPLLCWDGCNILLLHWRERSIMVLELGIKYWDSQTDGVNLMLVHYWISSTPPPCPATPLSVKTNLVLGISTDLFKNTIYISFGQGWDRAGIDICQAESRD